MPEIFRIETDQTFLSWSDRPQPDSDTISTQTDGRLAISLSQHISKKIKIWRRGLSEEAANNLQVEVGPRLYENRWYDLFLSSRNRKKVEILHRDPILLHDLHSLNGGRIQHGPIRFANEIGRSWFSVYAGGRAEYHLEVDVFPTTLDYAADYNVLLADIQDIKSGLGLEYLRSTVQFGFATEPASASRLEWILSLRHVVDQLESGIRYIEQHPKPDLDRERVPTKVEKLRRVDAMIARMIAQGRGEGPNARTASGIVIRRRLPERRSQITWDSADHRWLATQLMRIRRRLAEIYLVEAKRTTQNNLRRLRIVEEIAELENRISVLQRVEPLPYAKGCAPPNHSSLRLQTEPGYREAYQACLALLRELRLDGGPLRLSAKDTDRVYEYWCYLALVKLIAKLTGEQMRAGELFPVERNGLQVQLKCGTSQTMRLSDGDRFLELTYNSRYQNALMLPQQPDLVLTLYDPRRSTWRLIFDTRYQINRATSYVEEFGTPGPAPEAMDVLHRYRDAILKQTGLQGSRTETLKHLVVEAAALFPHADLQDQFRGSGFWLSLQEGGIGALPFLPSETRYVEEWLSAVLQRAGWPTTEPAIPDWSHEKLRSWQEAENQPVLIAILQRDGNEHLEWIKRERRYYTPLTPTQPRQLVARWLAIYSPPSIRTPGAITHLAEIENAELKKHDEIIYKLGQVSELERPIEDRGPRGLSKRFSKNCWTSRLGILKATELREIFMETGIEWRLCDQLRMAGAEFTLKPASARLQDQNDPAGRTWFVRKRLRVQYRGAAGFLLRRQGLRDEYRSDLTEVVERMLSQT